MGRSPIIFVEQNIEISQKGCSPDTYIELIEIFFQALNRRDTFSENITKTGVCLIFALFGKLHSSTQHDYRLGENFPIDF